MKYEQRVATMIRRIEVGGTVTSHIVLFANALKVMADKTDSKTDKEYLESVRLYLMNAPLP